MASGEMASSDPGEEPLAGQKGQTPAAIVTALAPRSVPLPAFAPRAEVTASIPTPETVPFAIASASTARAELAAAKPAATDADLAMGKADTAPARVAQDVVALNIPLPTWRPENQASPAHQPELAKSGDAIGALLVMNHYDDRRGRLAGQRVAAPASESEDRVRTSPKAGRVQPRGDLPEASAIVLPAAKGPLETDRGMTGGTGSATAPLIAANFIRRAPEQVYLDGFRSQRAPLDHRGFTGSAVKFLPVARFR
jgi:hypothetical protein